VDIENIVSIRFIPPEYHLKYRDDGKLGAIANIDLVHEHVQLVIDDPERARIELDLQESEDCPTAPEAGRTGSGINSSASSLSSSNPLSTSP